MGARAPFVYDGVSDLGDASFGVSENGAADRS
jgi:hypothetical protein